MCVSTRTYLSQLTLICKGPKAFNQCSVNRRHQCLHRAGYGAEIIIFAIKNAELIAELIAKSFQKPPIHTARLQN